MTTVTKTQGRKTFCWGWEGRKILLSNSFNTRTWTKLIFIGFLDLLGSLWILKAQGIFSTILRLLTKDECVRREE